MPKKFKASADDFTAPSLTITHFESGYTFWARRTRVTIYAPGEQDACDFIGLTPNDNDPHRIITIPHLRQLAARWLNENIIAVRGRESDPLSYQRRP